MKKDTTGFYVSEAIAEDALGGLDAFGKIVQKHIDERLNKLIKKLRCYVHLSHGSLILTLCYEAEGDILDTIPLDKLVEEMTADHKKFGETENMTDTGNALIKLGQRILKEANKLPEAQV